MKTRYARKIRFGIETAKAVDKHERTGRVRNKNKLLMDVQHLRHTNGLAYRAYRQTRDKLWCARLYT